MTRGGYVPVIPGADLLLSSLWPTSRYGGEWSSAQHPLRPGITTVRGSTVHPSDFLLHTATGVQESYSQIFSGQRVCPNSCHNQLPRLPHLSYHDFFSGLGVARWSSMSYLFPCVLYLYLSFTFLKHLLYNLLIFCMVLTSEILEEILLKPQEQ